jgi:hypothetical protein
MRPRIFRLSRDHFFLCGLLIVACALFFAESVTGRWEAVFTTLFSAITAWFSYLAYRFSEERFRLDLLDRRWVIYEGVLEFCSRVTAQVA